MDSVGWALADLDSILMIQLHIVWRYHLMRRWLTIATYFKEDGRSQTSSSAVYEGTLFKDSVNTRGDYGNNSWVSAV